ncbi:hypothetical protein JR316_0002952 [Psilocybe cubensis]|uniref:AIG1-type G domain-containing protein n=2 Tax=Psilocybe cubensis TaxID=181762 RepID=A0A8H7Y498_PSICU|nr:hypothetical protein JR316_0002952 [Psilocybe cubensis]KAH9483484.1 hypothetical protein JR316_0002952 [Psilocybe cubensis]
MQKVFSKPKIASTIRDQGELEKLLNIRNIVIPVMGPTGVGKSTFINAIVAKEFDEIDSSSMKPCLMEVGHGLVSCTKDVQASCIKSPMDLVRMQQMLDHSVVLVDTPGFDDTYRDDFEILQKIADWLKESYNDQHVIAGVIYLHDISLDRFPGSAAKNLDVFKSLCGRQAFSSIVMVETKGEKAFPDRVERYDQEMRNSFWKDLVEAGVTIRSFDNDYESARSVVDYILTEFTQKFILQLQKEVAEDHKLLPDTDAGRKLKLALKDVLERSQDLLSKSSVYNVDPETLKVMEETVKLLSAQVAALRKPSPLKAFFQRLSNLF